LCSIRLKSKLLLQKGLSSQSSVDSNEGIEGVSVAGVVYVTDAHQNIVDRFKIASFEQVYFIL
jgi:hypothetical protein